LFNLIYLDIPKDINRSFIILQLALRKANSEEEKKEIDFYLDYLQKINASNIYIIKLESKDEIIALNNKFYDKQIYNKKSKYVTYRDLFKIFTYSETFGVELSKLNVSKEMVEQFYMNMYELCEEVSKEGIYEAYYYLGIMNQKGLYTKVNKKKAFYYFCLAAANSHALSFYELFHILKNETLFDDIYKENKNRAMYDYLKYAAEEGYPAAMYELGNEYIKGEICPQNYYKALAWHRHACRNGYFLSYVNKILNLGTNRRSVLQRR
jgi:TPR repeat protein